VVNTGNKKIFFLRKNCFFQKAQQTLEKKKNEIRLFELFKIKTT
jgi:hypothetical protein